MRGPGPLLLICFVATLLRVPLLWGDFLDFDDSILIYENLVITWLDWAHLDAVSLTNFRGERQNMMHVADLLNWAASGGSYSGFAAFNLAWWAATICAVYGFAGIFLRDVRAQLGATALFAVHAVNTDTLGWMSARGHLLGMPFGMAAMVFWAHRRDHARPWLLYAGSLAMLAAALYAKLIFAGVAVGFVAVDIYQRRSWRAPSAWLDKLGPAAVVLAATPLPKGLRTPGISDSGRWFARLAAYVEYLWALVVPIPTSAVTWGAPPQHFLDTGGGGMPMMFLPPVVHLAILVGLAVGLGLAWRRGLRTPLLLAVLGAALIAPSMISRPVLPGIAIGYRYALGASACFSVALFTGVEWAWPTLDGRSRKVLAGALALLLLAHAGRSHLQSRTWDTPESHFLRCAENFPVTWVCHSRASAHRVGRTHDPLAAAAILEQAVKTRRLHAPRGRDSNLALQLADYYRDAGDRPSELRMLQVALEEDPLSNKTKGLVRERVNGLR